MRNKAMLLVVPLVAAGLAVSACSSDASGGGAGGGGGAATASVGSGGPSSRGGGTQNVTLMVGGLDKIIYLPAMLTQQLGYFKEQGLNVKLLNIPSGAGAAVDSVLTGQADAAVSFYDHSVDLAGLGKKTESVVNLDTVPGEVIVVPKKNESSITNVASLKGKTIGVTSLGGSGEYLTRYLVQHAGLSQSDIKVIVGGVGPTFIASVQHARFDAGMTTEPTVSQVTSDGSAKVIVDMRTSAGTKAALGGLYPGGALYTSRDYAAKHKDTIQKFVNAFVKTLAWIHSHTAEQIADKMPQDYYGGNKALYVQAVQNSLSMFNPTGLMPPAAPETVLKVLSTFDPNVKGKSINVNETWTDDFVKAARGSS